MFRRFLPPLNRAQQPEPFHYERLQPDSIRLLKLLPTGTGSKGIACELTHFEFSNCPPYTTLSYTWGSPSQAKKITVNGHAFKVRKNLHAFLEQALKSNEFEDQLELLWVDQICIDQSDIKERNEQVLLMGDIYHKAERTIVWLGPAAWLDESDLAMDIIQEVVRVIQQRDGEGEVTQQQPADGDGWVVCEEPRKPVPDEGDLEDEQSEKYQFALRKTNQTQCGPYFSDSTGHAPNIDIWCGSKCIDFALMATFIKENPFTLVRKRKDPVRLRFRIHESIQVMFYDHVETHGQRSYSLISAIGMFSQNECSDPRDKLYGLLGFVVEWQSKFTVDYSKTLLEVWADVLNWFATDNESQAHELDSVLDLGKTMGVVQHEKQRASVTEWVEEHSGQVISLAELEKLL
ncbi:hypothetical protein ACMFMG_006186 [Clarireedia jacksonii]